MSNSINHKLCNIKYINLAHGVTPYICYQHRWPRYKSPPLFSVVFFILGAETTLLSWYSIWDINLENRNVSYVNWYPPIMTKVVRYEDKGTFPISRVHHWKCAGLGLCQFGMVWIRDVSLVFGLSSNLV